MEVIIIINNNKNNSYFWLTMHPALCLVLPIYPVKQNYYYFYFPGEENKRANVLTRVTWSHWSWDLKLGSDPS